VVVLPKGGSYPCFACCQIGENQQPGSNANVLFPMAGDLARGDQLAGMAAGAPLPGQFLPSRNSSHTTTAFRFYQESAAPSAAAPAWPPPTGASTLLTCPRRLSGSCVTTGARKFFENWRTSLKWQRLKPYEKFADRSRNNSATVR